MNNNLCNNLFNSISGRDKCYRFLQFCEKFLSPLEKTPKTKAIYWIIKHINHYIVMTRHVNKFGMSFDLVKKLKIKLKNKYLFCLSIDELMSIISDFLNIFYTFLDHLIFLCKINVITNIEITKLYKLSGLIWFINITSIITPNMMIYYKNKKITKKEKCILIKCVCDYIVLLNLANNNKLLPKWITGIFGMLSSALSIYTKYLLK